MTIECYYQECQYHSCHENPDDGPFCYEDRCKADYQDLHTYMTNYNLALSNSPITEDVQIPRNRK